MRKYNLGFSILTFFLLNSGSSLQAQTSNKVVINEILANEPSSRTKLEWVELYNTDTSDIDLGGWTFICKSDTTVFSSGTLIPGKNYLIIARKLVSVPPDSESFECYWGNRSGVWGDDYREDYPALEVKLSLTNSSGSVTLIDLQENSTTFSWNKDPGDGISWERILSEGEDSLSNWGFCIYSQGSTPGKVNSLTPVSNDLSISSENISIEPQSPEENVLFRLSVKVKNSGISNSEENLLHLFCDYDFDGDLEENESLGMPVYIPSLDLEEELTLTKELSLLKGNYRLYALIGEDEKNYNNQTYISVCIGQSLPDIVINEFLCSPDENQTEWVEFYNRSESVIDLRNSFFGDSLEQSPVTDEELYLYPGDYLILCEDISRFSTAYPEANCIIKEPASWHTLNNSGDKLILKDSLGFIIDQVSYTSEADIKGVSQERVSPEKVSSDEDNWWRSVDPQGSTPCEKNSLQDSYLADQTKLEISPNPFSPDGDGFEDQAKISYTIPFRSELTLKIFDVKGRLVKTLLEKEPQVSGEVFWNGEDDKGRTVKVGIYILYLETSGSGNASRKTTIVVAKR